MLMKLLASVSIPEHFHGNLSDSSINLGRCLNIIRLNSIRALIATWLNASPRSGVGVGMNRSARG